MMLRHKSFVCALFIACALTAGYSQASHAQETQSQPAARNIFAGSVATGEATSQVLPLTMKDAIQLALKNNLAAVLLQEDVRGARASRLQAMSRLLPDVSARLAENVQQNNLAVFGLDFPGIPTIVGPFSFSDARAGASIPLLDVNALQRLRAAKEDEKAARFSYSDARETIVLYAANLYLLSLTTAARIEAVDAQLKTSQAALDQAINLRKAGVVAGIDVLRAQVEMQARRQRSVALRNELSKQKLDLARAIGLPLGQAFEFADRMPYAPPANVNSLEQALQRAYAERSDFKRAQSLIRSAELSRQAAEAEYLPTLRFDGDYGVIGRTFGSSHGTFTAAASLRIPIFNGGKTRANVLAKDVDLRRQQALLNDLKGSIDSEVRKAFLDLQAADEMVNVARESRELAEQALVQSRDRFAAGVANNLEVVQSQESVAAAQDSYIFSVYEHNIAKARLAKAMGIAEQAVTAFLEGRK